MNQDELHKENQALNEQVKLLVKTERRLYGAQRVIEAQLRRLHALTTVATQAARLDDTDRILELALIALRDALDLDQAIALTVVKGDGARLAATATQPGREPPQRRWGGRALALPPLDGPMLLAPRPEAVAATMRPLLEAVDDYFAPRVVPAIELVVPLHRKSGALLGLLVLRKVDRAVSFHEPHIGEEDLPFVELMATRVETDVENVLLYRELESFAAALEQKVAERTAALAHSNTELGHSLQRVRETQQQLVEASKRAAMLTLVGGLSHELNNPIGVILGYAQGLLAGGPSPAMQRPLAAIERQARRCSRLVKALLGLADNRPLALDSIPPAVLLRSAAADAERDAATRGVRVYVGLLEEDLPSLFISEENMREAIGELVKNALDATARGGTVALSARARMRSGIVGVELTIRDSGAGIPRAFLSRVFDPFFTTKPPGKGVGLGLSLVRQVIEAHAGRVDVKSELGQGTTVRVWLPVNAAARQAADEARTDAEGAP